MSSSWKAFIIGISYYDPAAPIESTENNVQILSASNSSEAESLVSREDFEREQQEFQLARQLEERQKQEAFDEYLVEANKYRLNKQYQEALEFYGKAKELKPLTPALDKKILDTKRLVSGHNFETLKSQADQARNERRYSDALQYYKEALTIRPEAHTGIDAEITTISKKLEEIELPKNRLEAGNYAAVIEACDNILKKNKKDEKSFPELYYYKGRANQLAAEKRMTGSWSLDHALEFYNKAIVAFPNYVDARLARASFYATHKRDYARAITDYEVVANNTLDSAPEKPSYLLAMARWRDLSDVANGLDNHDRALSYYQQAITLLPDAGAARMEMGTVLYRLKRYADALNTFNTVAKQDAKNSAAYYMRGKCYLALKDVTNAGVDFAMAEAIGITPAQLLEVENASKEYVDQALKLFAAKQLAKADSAYDCAISIRRCNQLAWYGKGEIKLAQAPAAGAYEQALERYQKALDCNPKYSAAHLRRGEIYQQTGQYPLALSSYTAALESDASNVKALLERGSTKVEMAQYAEASKDLSLAAKVLEQVIETAKKKNQEALVASSTQDLSLAYQLLSQSYYQQKQYVNASMTADKALQSNKKNAEALYWLGLTSAAQNDAPKAIRSYEQAIKLAPLFKYYHANGKVLLNSKNYEQAIGNFSAALKADSGRAARETYYLRGLSYMRNKNYTAAAKDFRVCARATEGLDSLFYLNYGVLDLYLNNNADAIGHFNQVLSHRPDNPQAVFGLGCAYARDKQYDKALQQFEKAYQLQRLRLRKEDVETQEDAFLMEFNKIKNYRTQYTQLKKNYAFAPN
ncbi:tetratricopeptide repeat protein [Hymenobacter sp. 15J16-1T3B]|uniref:tetratricopeptide repeat protein n=1 Tax=Hymenobacter sp. 15J16-1T3B TaxID=2886941 RepID=UPI001D1210DA|nr:tetratricopeptide repeat protein [Hymenobacter sp. 15J16-1T3B]